MWPVNSTTRIAPGRPLTKVMRREKVGELRVRSSSISPTNSTAAGECSRMAGGSVAGLSEGVEVGDGEGGGLGGGNEVYPGFGDDAEGAFGADHHLAEVYAFAIHKPVDVCSR